MQIQAADLAGKPISGSMALTAYDKSSDVLQPEDAGGRDQVVRWRRRRTNYRLTGVVSSLAIAIVRRLRNIRLSRVSIGRRLRTVDRS